MAIGSRAPWMDQEKKVCARFRATTSALVMRLVADSMAIVGAPFRWVAVIERPRRIVADAPAALDARSTRFTVRREVSRKEFCDVHAHGAPARGRRGARRPGSCVPDLGRSHDHR